MNWANIPKQTRLVENGVAGDCWRCCIAAMLHLPAEMVPHFLQEELDRRGRDDYKSMDSLTQAWLIERGYALVRSNHFCVDYCWSDERCRVPVIKCGPTPRSKAMNQHHSVIYIRDEMVYDPHPSNAGLTAVCDEYMVVKLPLPEAAL